MNSTAGAAQRHGESSLSETDHQNMPPTGRTLAEEVASVRWQHTIELPGGVVTPGRWDVRPTLRRVELPDRLDGKRCLTVGTDDGFWAFELERRGASEVVAVRDDDSRWEWPARHRLEDVELVRRIYERNEAFEIARRALGSRVRAAELSIYDLSPKALGQFDFAVVGFMLLHLRDPVRGLAAVRSVLRGQLVVAELVSLSLSVLRPRTAAADLRAQNLPHWWAPNVAGLRRFVEAAGFEVVRTGSVYVLRPGRGGRGETQETTGRARLRRWASKNRGVAATWILAQPASEPRW